jgi:hypothetical protein
MSATFAITRRVKINAHLSADMTAGAGGFVVEWIAGVPRRLSPAEQRRYRRGRDRLLAELSARMGGARILVVET